MTNEKDLKDKANESEELTKALYETPSLFTLGKLTSLTMGSPGGTGESGNAGLFRP